MTLTQFHKDVQFGVGDEVKVYQKIKEGEIFRSQVFDGIVISIKNVGANRTLTVRKIGEGGIGVERIFALASPFLEKIEVVKKGLSGVRRSKLYYIRGKSPKEIEEIYSRAREREENKNKMVKKNAPKKKK